MQSVKELYRIISILLILIFLSAAACSESPVPADPAVVHPGSADPAMFHPETAEPGSVLQVVITGDEIEGISLSLNDGQGQSISEAKGFRWYTPTRRSISAVLLGVPPSAEPGEYSLVMNAHQGEAEWRLESSVEVAEFPFPEQVINMNEKMVSLYDDNSERKKEEAQILWDILLSSNPDNQHFPGRFQPPLVQSVPTSEFGQRRLFRMPSGSESRTIHYGQDLWAEQGTDIFSPARGRVVLSADRLLTGNSVIIEHLPGVYTLYYHMDSLAVLTGQMVETGDKIGTLGTTGFSTGPHLHWEMRVGGAAIDPRRYLEQPLLDTNALMSRM